MCYADVWPDFYRDDWRRARREHRCSVCGERMLPRHYYHVVSGKWEGEVRTYKHCARCWTLYERLSDDGCNDVDLELDCGETYEGDDPEMHALAFVTREEAQGFVPRRTPQREVR